MEGLIALFLVWLLLAAIAVAWYRAALRMRPGGPRRRPPRGTGGMNAPALGPPDPTAGAAEDTKCPRESPAS